MPIAAAAWWVLFRVAAPRGIGVDWLARVTMTSPWTALNVMACAVIAAFACAGYLSKQRAYGWAPVAVLFAWALTFPGLVSGVITLALFAGLYFLMAREIFTACDAAVPRAEIRRSGFPMAFAFVAGLVLTLVVGDVFTIVARGLCPGTLALYGV